MKKMLTSCLKNVISRHSLIVPFTFFPFSTKSISQGFETFTFLMISPIPLSGFIWWLIDQLTGWFTRFDVDDLKHELTVRSKGGMELPHPSEYPEKLTQMLIEDPNFNIADLALLESKSREEIIQDMKLMGFEVPSDSLTTELAIILIEEERKREAYFAELKEAQEWEEQYLTGDFQYKPEVEWGKSSKKWMFQNLEKYF